VLNLTKMIFNFGLLMSTAAAAAVGQEPAGQTANKYWYSSPPLLSLLRVLADVCHHPGYDHRGGQQPAGASTNITYSLLPLL
jgi:hypothetical protein